MYTATRLNPDGSCLAGEAEGWTLQGPAECFAGRACHVACIDHTGNL